MGTYTAEEVVEQASILLHDRGQRKWTVEELLTWLKAGQIAIVGLRPDAYTLTIPYPLIAGTRQLLPDDALELLDVARNLGADGATPGPACFYVDRKQLDQSDPNWHTSTASATARHWMYDRANKKTWWVWPPQPNSDQGKVELTHSAVPPELTIKGVKNAANTSLLALDDVFINPLASFAVYRSYSKDSEYTQAGGKADLAFREFLQFLGMGATAVKAFNPQANQPPRYDAPPKSDSQGAFGKP